MSRAVAKIEDGAPEWAIGLNEREIRWVQEYLVDLNARQAAIRAKLGKTPKSASEIASRMRRKQSVASAIAKLLSERAGATGSRLIEELAAMALVDVTQFAQVKDGRMIVTNTADLTPEQRAAVVGVKETINEKGMSTIEYRFDKLAALDKLARALSLYKERVEVSGQFEVVDMTSAHERLAILLGIGVAPPQPLVEVQSPIKRIAAPVRQSVRVIDGE